MIRKQTETYLGQLCKNKHDYASTKQSLRYGLDRACIECKKEKVKRQVVEGYHKRYRAQNHTKYLEYNREYWQKTKDKPRNKRTLGHTFGVYQLKDSDTFREIWKEKEKYHNEDVQARRASRIISEGKRRAKKVQALVIPFTELQWLLKCRNQFKWSCAYCKCVLTHKTVTQDHIIPICLGGEHSIRNLVPACCSCNSSKNGANPVTWCYEKFGYLPVWLETLVFEDWFAKKYLRISSPYQRTD